MSDYNSSLPIRTENPGDAAVKIVDATLTSQGMAVDSSGRTTGNQGAANTIGNAWPVKPTDGTNSQSFTAAGEAKVSVTQPLPAGSNTIGAVTQASGPWSQNITQVAGAAMSATNFLSIRVTNGTSYVDPTQIRALTATDVVSANLKDGSGNAITSSAAGSARPLDVALRDSSGNLLGSATNPVSVSFSSAPVGTAVDNYLVSSAIAANATSNHDYTVTSGKTLILKQIEATGSGKAKMEVQIETAAASGVFNTIVVQFNSTANTNMSVHFDDPKQVVSGARVRVIRTNRDNQPQDLYSTIMGQEV